MAENTLAEQIATQLRRDILRGKLVPGTSVKERDNAAEMGVSRTPMREAIRILAKEGLVILRPARSPIVAELSLHEVENNIEVLTALEMLSGELAVKRASDTQLQEIADIQSRMERLYDDLNMVDVFELDMEFHKAIVRAAGNQVLADTHGAILARLWRARYLSASRKRSRDRVLAQHNAIVAGLRARDTEMIKQHLHSHLEHLVINVRDFFEQDREDLPPEPTNQTVS
ncbi:GntR family transcriptional regulator [Rhodovulum imhoffii]|uniref:GntR family transcriptional regulator n=1 Tax=Rhodovulum imhoffii TaxID=365340 RepID=A0A2T5BQD1_9RHOB|nr:GntR family transcriptional regulator [Rhodovulum imhoffii]MBK5933695.1 GntR family transcriptional regulator [Rhodovulum imhoffii]PTN01325.1 GntR family transcriptional regulator [Rhodovulum imhoffii]